jgi:hypothetical protein
MLWPQKLIDGQESIINLRVDRRTLTAFAKETTMRYLGLAVRAVIGVALCGGALLDATIACAQPCTITCPANQIRSTDSNQCGAIGSYNIPQLSGNCGTLSCSPSIGFFFPKGMSTVACTTGAGSQCSFSITVNDTQAPLIALPVNPYVITAFPGQPGTTVTFANLPVLDNCPNPGPLVCFPPLTSTFPVGVTTVSCTGTDAANNQKIGDFDLSVWDVCLQDDLSGDFILFNSFNGQYELHVCHGAVGCGDAPITFVGQGVVTFSGSKVKLSDKSPGRKVSLTFDLDKHAGRVSATFNGVNKLKVKIKDPDSRNNTCSCP